MGRHSVQPATPAWHRFQQMLTEPVSSASLAAFRFCFGMVLVWHMAKQLWPGSSGRLIDYMYAIPAWNFRYPGFEWVHPWPEPYLTIHFTLVCLAAFLFAIGWMYRPAMVAFFFGYTYTFLLEATKYNNHYYLISLVSFLLIWMPAAEGWSVDAWLRNRRTRIGESGPLANLSGSIPFWPIFVLRSQLFIMYFYGGLAKFNADWLTGEPLVVPAQKLLDQFGQPGFLTLSHVTLFMAWGGLFYDLSIGFLLLWRRTRFLAIALTFFFHLHNHFIFPIGIFPTMAFTATLIFFEPDWPIRFAGWLRRPSMARPDWKWLGWGAACIPPFGALLGWKCAASESDNTKARQCPLLAVLVVAWITLQAVIPLRHHVIEGDANWTEEGQDFAWRMMLRAKGAGYVMYYLDDPGLISSNGKLDSVRWEEWPTSAERAVYVPIDSHYLNWNQHAGMTITFEPALGARIIFNPIGLGVNPEQDMQRAHERIVATWKKSFNREPQVQQTISLDVAVNVLLRHLYDPRARLLGSEKQIQTARLRLNTIRDALRAPSPDSKYETEKTRITTSDLLSQLMASPLAPMMHPVLRRIHPFEIQGAPQPLTPLLVIEDPGLSAPAAAQDLLRLSKGKPYLVWLDLSRMRPEGWRELPKAFVSYEHGNLRVVWNYFHDVNHIQLERFAVRPHLIRQYAQHVADTWEGLTARRPQVHVSSFVMLNYRYPQSLIDPRVDLAATNYTAFGHNDWILPLSSDRVSANQPEIFRR